MGRCLCGMGKSHIYSQRKIGFQNTNNQRNKEEGPAMHGQIRNNCTQRGEREVK